MTAADLFLKEVQTLERQRKCGRHEAWTLQKQMSPELYAAMERDEQAPASALANAVEIAGGPTLPDENRSDFVSSLVPSWVWEALGISAEPSDLMLEQRFNRNSLVLTAPQAQRALAAMTDALAKRSNIAREAARAKLEQRAYYIFKFARQ